jgi:hypothetical protein
MSQRRCLPGAVGRPPGNVFSDSLRSAISSAFMRIQFGRGRLLKAGNLISQQLDCAVKQSVVMRLDKALLAVVDKPDHPFLFDRLPEQRIRLQHPFLFSSVNNHARETPSSEPD